MWGTPRLLTVISNPSRITPTCVGNTLSGLESRGPYRDHPHLCGEHLTDKAVTDSELGSPPPVWGTHDQQAQKLIKLGITPTCVGNTFIIRPLFPLAEDHPHLCGEHTTQTEVSLKIVGSPPPVWGTPVKGDNNNEH